MSDLPFHLIFSPQNCTLELLEATLTPKRKELAMDILGRLEHACKKGPACHNLIIGPRGSGKTHVLSLIRRKLEKLCRGNSSMVTIPLSEEERTIARLLDFIVVCIRALGVPLGEAMARIQGVPRAAAVDEALAVFHERVAGRGALILVENFDLLVGKMEEEQIHELRAFFQAEPRISLLASATSLFQNSDRADHPFYGFFLIDYLQPLDRRECREFLKLVAQAVDDKRLDAAMGQRNAQARVNAIYDLTGGNHRLLTMLSPFLTADGLQDLVGPFVQMVDRQLTPYYGQRLDRLNPQQNMVLRAIVDISTMDNRLGRAVGLGEILEYTLLSSQHCSRLLHDLRYTGLVRTIKKGRESLYELNEPLLRLALDMKEGRSRPLPLIVNILKLWYEAEELSELAKTAPACIRDYYVEAERMIGLLPGKEDKGARAFTAFDGARQALEGARTASEKGRKQGYAKEAAEGTGVTPHERTQTERLIDEAIQTAHAGRHEEALDLFQKVLDVADDLVTDDQVAWALANKGVALGALGRSDEALAVYDAVVERFGGREEPALLEPVAKALVNKGVRLGALGRSEEAIVVYDAVVERFAGREELPLLEPVARALVDRGATLGSLGRSEEELVVYDAVVERFADREEPALLEQVAWALFNKGATLGALGHSEEALVVYDAVVERFGDREEPALLEQVARALFNKGRTLGALGRSEEAIWIYDAVVERFAGREEPALLEPVARALVSKAVTLGALGRGEEATAVYDTVVERFAGREDPAL